MRMIDLEYIKKWINITDAELMERLVKDAVGLQKEAEKKEHEAIVAKRMEDETYNIEFVRFFYYGYSYLAQFFSDEEILTACKHHAAKSDLATEETIRGIRTEDTNYYKVIRTVRSAEFEESSRNGWTRRVRDEGTVILVSNQYQSLVSGKIARELLTTRLPYLTNFKVSVYAVDEHNDWIFIKNPAACDNRSSVSLYVSAKDLLTKNTEHLLDVHRKYWHNYGNGTDDADVEKFLQSEFVQNFITAAIKN